MSEPITITFDDDGMVSVETLKKLFEAGLENNRHLAEGHFPGFICGFRCLERLAKSVDAPMLLFLSNLRVCLKSSVPTENEPFYKDR